MVPISRKRSVTLINIALTMPTKLINSAMPSIHAVCDRCSGPRNCSSNPARASRCCSASEARSVTCAVMPLEHRMYVRNASAKLMQSVTRNVFTNRIRNPRNAI